MIKILGESKRGAVFRTGRFHRVAGPGLVLYVPFLDRLVVVDLKRTIPDWRVVPPRELQAMVEFLVTSYPEIPSHLSLEEIREAMVQTRT
jgi:regulator of protease activity HflC (stomatin/prohibitin superfamily)